jgi:hypothetical protein
MQYPVYGESPAVASAMDITHSGGSRMNDMYVIESWFGERLNVRNVCAADEHDACQTHELHYPGELIVSVRATAVLACPK